MSAQNDTSAQKQDLLSLGEIIVVNCIRSELLVQSFRTLLNFVGYMFSCFIEMCYHSAFCLTTLCCKRKTIISWLACIITTCLKFETCAS